MDVTSGMKRVRDDSSESWLELSESKRLRHDLLEFFDETDIIPSTQDLESIMKSFQDEISASPSPAPITVTSNSGEAQPHIGYLLGASDDELGIPPPGDLSVPEEKEEDAELFRDSFEIGELWQSENQINRCESFDMGNRFSYENSNTDFVSFDGLFDHSDLYYDSPEFTESWRHETMPAQPEFTESWRHETMPAL